MSLTIIILLAFTLSMDAFSLALLYGTLNISNNIKKVISISVGLFHFFMPIIGYHIGELILKIILVKIEYLSGIIFIILGLDMLNSTRKEDKIIIIENIISIILFSLSVSIDSFSIGISFGVTKTNILLACSIFSLISAITTYIGLSLGNRLSNRYGKLSVIIGSIILIILGINNFT